MKTFTLAVLISALVLCFALHARSSSSTGMNPLCVDSTVGRGMGYPGDSATK